MFYLAKAVKKVCKNSSSEVIILLTRVDIVLAIPRIACRVYKERTLMSAAQQNIRH